MTLRLDADSITIWGINATGYHGVLENERREGQQFYADIALFFDTRPAAASDDLSKTVDYSLVAGEVCSVLQGEPCSLIETLAERIATRLLSRFPVEALQVTVYKPHAPLTVPFENLKVTIFRERQ